MTVSYIVFGTVSGPGGDVSVKMPAPKPTDTFAEDSVAAIFEYGDENAVAGFLSELQGRGVKTRPAAEVLADWNTARGRSA